MKKGGAEAPQETSPQADSEPCHRAAHRARERGRDFGAEGAGGVLAGVSLLRALEQVDQFL